MSEQTKRADRLDWLFAPLEEIESYRQLRAAVEKGGVVLLSLRQAENAITISVEDNGDSLSDATLDRLRASVASGPRDENDSIALVNIHRRLQLHFGPQSGLLFDRSGLGGLKAAILIVPGEGRPDDAADSAGR